MAIRVFHEIFKDYHVNKRDVNLNHRQTATRRSEIALGGTARSPEDALALYELGLDFAEISTNNFPKYVGDIDGFTKVIESVNLYYLCHGPNEGDPNDISSLESDYMPRVIDILETLPSLNVSLLTLHLWMDCRFVNPTVIDYKIRTLGEIIDRAAEKSITICLENLSENWKDLNAAFKELPGLHLTLDVGHAQLLRSETSAYGLIAAYPDRIKHIHLHDNLGGDLPENDLHLPPGRGIVDFKGIFDALKGIGYTGTATLELKLKEIKSCLSFVKALLR